jgi:hypothetical protein
VNDSCDDDAESRRGPSGLLRVPSESESESFQLDGISLPLHHHHPFLCARHAPATRCRISICSSTTCACLSRNCTSPGDYSRFSTCPPSRLLFASTTTSTSSRLTSRLGPFFHLTTAGEPIRHILHHISTSSWRSAAALAASARPTRTITPAQVSALQLSVLLQQTLVSQESCSFPFLRSSTDVTLRLP